MPSDVTGLAVLIIFVLPGLVFLLRRRALVPQPVSSAFVEVASLIAVSTFTNLAALLVFALLRSIRPSNTPNVGEMMKSPAGYLIDRPGYVLAWTVALVAVSSLLALLWANGWGPFGWLARRYAPTIIPASAWYWIDQSAPKGSLVHVGCDLADGAFVSGYVSWYNSDPSESPTCQYECRSVE